MAADDKPRKRLGQYAKGIALVAATLFLVKIAAPLLSAQSAEVIVEDLNNIPASCSTGVINGEIRSSIPDPVVPGHCGAVFTSLGLFQLVESGSLNPLAMRREDMVATMKPSCRYRIWFSGTGPMPFPGAKATNELHKTIFRLTPLDVCHVN